ncbi:MAG TPA: hypothetical protein VGH77_13420 [Streptosporangiaceae bacterium]
MLAALLVGVVNGVLVVVAGVNTIVVTLGMGTLLEGISLFLGTAIIEPGRFNPIGTFIGTPSRCCVQPDRGLDRTRAAYRVDRCTDPSDQGYALFPGGPVEPRSRRWGGWTVRRR